MAFFKEEIPHIYYCYQGRDIFQKILLNSWMLIMVSWLAVTECLLSPLNSLVIRTISGPATVHLLSALVFPVRPIAPPDPLTRALFCSWHWSIAIAENLLLVL